ncbi:hypothetical protein JOC77_001656 [Peribacillus deserti]|uniref:Uncharacterized protein n=1 Tax=Peribacillus deserti TaxID=673318 RepID=A0ABS2QGE3_9BACI|nr:hypothetical protein [Peribacillus deserti]
MRENSAPFRHTYFKSDEKYQQVNSDYLFQRGVEKKGF